MEGNESSNWNEEAACKENSKPKTLGWSNPAWGPRVPESNPAWGPKLMMGIKRTQSPGLVSTKPTEGPKKQGWKNKALAPTFSRFEKSLYLSLHYHTIRFRVSLFFRNLFSLLFRFLPPRTAYSPWLLFVHIPTFSSHFLRYPHPHWGSIIQRHKNLGSRVALLPGKFLRVRKFFARITEKTF